MSNIFESLEHAQRSSISEEVFDAAQKLVESPATVAATEMEQEMVGIYRNIDALLPDSPRKVIQFIGSRLNEGVSTIVREFAMVVAKMGKSVLILDAAQGNGDQRNFFRINNNRGWDEAVSDLAAMDETINSIGDSNLYVSCLSCSSGANRQIFDTCQLSAFFEALKTRFDHVLVDTPPAITAMDGIVLSRCVDGVVLVVEADKTRWPVAEKIKTKIQKSGGNILGVVFNKRRFYIPEWLYRML